MILLAVALLAQDQIVGTRAKGMGGGYTAFDDEPTSIWLNPAGIAGQPTQITIHYQSFTAYEPKTEPGTGSGKGFSETTYSSPLIIPSYAGVVWRLGSPESPRSFGAAYISAFHVDFTYDTDGADGQFDLIADQRFDRVRWAFAQGLRLRPVGDAGWFPSLSFGVAVDIGYTEVKITQFGANGRSFEDSDGALSGGVGVLTTVFDNLSSCRIAWGLATQFPIKYDLQVSTGQAPLFDWPVQVSSGIAVHMLEGAPLRASADVQYVGWDRATDKSDLPGVPDFDATLSVSVGLEYRVDFAQDIFVTPRVGYRRFDAPWGRSSNLPAIDNRQLVIDTEGGAFDIYSAGLSVTWRTEDGRTRTVDLAIDFGGDRINTAIGYVHEF
jgi:hypothetical protein